MKLTGFICITHHLLTKANLIKWWVSRNKLETITFTNSCNYSPWVYFCVHAQRWHIDGASMEHVYIMGPWGQNTSQQLSSRLSYRPKARNNNAEAMLEMHYKWPCTTATFQRNSSIQHNTTRYLCCIPRDHFCFRGRFPTVFSIMSNES